MRGDDDVREPEDRPRRVGLLREHVQRRAGDVPRAQRVDQCVQVDQVSAGGVHDPHARLHQGDPVGVDQVRGLGRERRVQGDEVGLQEQVLERCGRHLQLPAAIGRHERVEHDDAHPERPCAGGDQLADAPEADDAEHLVRQLDAAEALALPAALDQRGVCLGDVAGQREEQPERVLGRRHHVRAGRVGDDDPAAGGRRDVDVVDPRPGPPDHLQPARMLEQLGRDTGRAADDQGVVGADPAGQSLRLREQVDVDLELLTQQLDPGGGDLLGDQHAGTVRHRWRTPRSHGRRRRRRTAGDSRAPPAPARARPAPSGCRTRSYSPCGRCA